MPSDETQNGPGGGSDDPWAGIDADTTPAEGDSFEFPDFDLTANEPAAGALGEAAPPTGPDAGGVPPFDALSLGAKDGVFTDDGGWDQPAAGAEQAAVEPVDPPLAVFPPFESEQTASDQPEPPEPVGPVVEPTLFDDSGDLGIVSGEVSAAPSAEAGDVDAMAFLEDQGEPAFEGLADPGPGESAIQIGTDQSGILPFEDVAGSSEATLADAVTGPDSPLGEPSFDDIGFEASSEEASPVAAESSLADGAFAESFAEDAFATSALDGDAIAGEEAVVGELLADDSPTEAPVFGGLEPDASPAFAVEQVAAAGVGAAVATTVAATAAAGKKAKPVRKVVKRRSGGGSGLAAAISVLLGGALAIPIVIGLLFWVFKKDPFHIAGKIPTSMSFLLPAEFQVAARGRKLPGVPKGDTLVASRSLDELVADQPSGAATTGAGTDSPPATDPAADLLSEEPAATAKPAPSNTTAAPKGADPAADLFGEESDSKPSPKEPPKPPPLDTSALDEAVATADDMTTGLLAADESDPAFKRMLRDWYMAIAKVGEETVALEQKATETGRDFDARSPAVERAVGRVLGNERTSAQFAKLSRMWLKARGRSSDGVVLPAVMVSSRKVGGWWSSRARISEDPEVPEVLVLSRSRPDASEGDSAVVLGLVFEPGVVWASAFGRFEPVSTDEVDEAEEEPADEEDETKEDETEEDETKEDETDEKDVDPDESDSDEEGDDESAKDESDEEASEEDDTEEDDTEEEEAEEESDDEAEESEDEESEEAEEEGTEEEDTKAEKEESDEDASDEEASDEEASDEEESANEEESEEASEEEDSKKDPPGKKPAPAKPSSRDDDLFPPE